MATGSENHPGNRDPQPDPGSAYIEQYKLYAQSADSNSARRISVNRYQAGLNIAVVALYGLTETIVPQPVTVIQIFIALVGVILALAWLGAIWSMRRLNVEKFKIIHSMEEHLPRAIYYEEWEGLAQASGWHYRHLHDFEKIVPIAFSALHISAFCYFGYTLARALLCS